MKMASLQNAVCEFFDIRENVSKSTTKQFKVFKVIKRYHLVCLCLHGMYLDHISELPSQPVPSHVINKLILMKGNSVIILYGQRI